MVESFGIPQPEANLQAVQEIVTANANGLRTLAVDALTPIVAQMTENETGLRSVENSLRRSLNGRLAANGRRLADTGNALRANLAAQAGVMEAQLAEFIRPIVDVPTGVLSNVVPAEGWYAVWEGQFGACDARLLPAGLDMGFRPIQGPFATREEANAICPAGDTPALPPPSSLPEAPSPPLLPSPVQAWVVWVDAANRCEVVAPGASPTRMPATAVVFTDTEEEALEWTRNNPPCGVPAEPKPAPPEPPVRPPIVITPDPIELPSQLTCPTTLGGPFPLIGSPEWCACIDRLRTWFRDVGESIQKKLTTPAFGTREEKETTGNFFADLWTTASGIVDVPGKIIDAIADVVIGNMKLFWGTLNDIVKNSLPCDPRELLGIVTLHALVDAFRELQVGLTIPVTVWAKINLVVPQMSATLDYVTNYLCAYEIPSPAETMDAYLQSTVSESQARCWLALKGVDFDVWWPVIEAKRERLTPAETIRLLKRKGATAAEIEEELLRRGFTRPVEAAAAVELYDEFPTISDLLLFLVRNLYDRDYVNRFGLTEGFEEQFWANYGTIATAIGLPKWLAQQHYEAHWILPAVGQMQEMLFRLRPGAPGVKSTFTEADFNRLLVEHDFNRYFRDRFTEIAYRVPAPTFLREMYRQGVVDDERYLNYIQDQGYRLETANQFLGVDRIVKTRLRTRESHGWTPDAIAKGFIAGVLTRDDVHQKMGDLAYTDGEAIALMERAEADLTYLTVSRARFQARSQATRRVVDAQTAGVLDLGQSQDELQALGFPEEQAAAVALSVDVRTRTGLVKKATARVRQAFLRGEVDIAGTRALLIQLGLVPGFIELTLTAWAIELSARSRKRSAAQIVRDLSEGEMGAPEAVGRLAALGYADPEARLFLADAQRKLLTREARLARAASASTARRERELERIVKEAERQQQEATAALRRMAPIGKLQTWVAKGIIDEAFFTLRMERLGYDPATIIKYYQEACSRKGAVCPETEASPPGT